MEIEQKLEIVRKALENAAQVSVNIHRVKGKTNAEEIIKDLTIDTDLGYELSETGKWYCHKKQITDVSIAVFFELNAKEMVANLQEKLSEYMEEDVFNEEAEQA